MNIVASCLDAKPYADHESKESRLVVAHTLRAEGFDASEDGTGRGTPIVAAYQCHGSNVGEMGTLRRGNGGVTGGVPFVAFQKKYFSDRDEMGGKPSALAPALTSANAERSDGEISVAIEGENAGPANCLPFMQSRMAVRGLTPLECLRLQGFPDDWLDGLDLSDSAKYRMCGNAVTVSVVLWIARRIAGLAAEAVA